LEWRAKDIGHTYLGHLFPTVRSNPYVAVPNATRTLKLGWKMAEKKLKKKKKKGGGGKAKKSS